MKDVIIIKNEEHKKAHLYLTLNLEERLFYTNEGIVLNYKENHIEYLIKKGIKF